MRAALRARRAPAIVLLTDFGLSDPYVGVMKGVIRARAPHVDIIDLSHDVQPQQVREGSFFLWSTFRYFPAESVFVCVVDPGVGTARRLLAVRTAHHVFLAPDNGLLDLVASEERFEECVSIAAESVQRIGLPHVSATFHGRDIFAPIAAYLAAGHRIKPLGRPTPYTAPERVFVAGPADATKPVVLHIDRFGNIVTNIRAIPSQTIERCDIRIRGSWVHPWTRTYSDAPERTPCLIAGSSGLVEIMVKNGNAARQLNVSLDAAMEVRWR